MRVLLIHQHFSHPKEGGAIRSYSLARFLVNAGHSVDVITRINTINQPEIQVIDGIAVHYLPVAYSNDMSFLKRIPSYLKFVYCSISYFHKLRKDFDLNYCISTPLTSGLIGLWLLKKYQLPFIFEVGDLWPDAPIALKAIRFPLTKYLLKKLESFIYTKSTAVIGLSPAIVNAIKTRTSTSVYYVPNFSDNKFFRPVEKTHQNFVISYVGTLGRANELEYMLNAAKLCQENGHNIHFNIMGEGARRKALKQNAKLLDLKNVKFHDFGNKEAVRDLLNKTDAAYVSYKNLKILETGSPNKFFDGLAAGKLIILNFGGWLAEYVSEYSCGFSYKPDKPEEFVEKLTPFLKDPQLLDTAKFNARKLAEEKFALNYWENKFVELLTSFSEK